MALKTILVCLTSKEHAEAAMKLAVPLAREHGAHLVGLHTIEAILVYPGIAMHIPDAAFSAFVDSQMSEAGAIEAIFEKYTSHEDFVSEWRLLRAESVSAVERMSESAHAADVVIIPNSEAETDQRDQRDLLARIIRDSGRPVIVVPSEYDGNLIGQNCVLGWSNTREAARAAHDLLLVARPGGTISVTRVEGVSDDEMSDFEAINIAAMFDRQELRASVVHRDLGGNDIADVLIKLAFEMGADLIATGAFGHSRAYDFVIGSVTQQLLRKAKLPVLFST